MVYIGMGRSWVRLGSRHSILNHILVCVFISREEKSLSPVLRQFAGEPTTMVNPFRLRGRDRRQQSYRLNEKPPIERHYVSVLGSAMSIITLVLALTLKVWATGKNTSCNVVFGLTSVTISYLHQNFTHHTPSTYSSELYIVCLLFFSFAAVISWHV